MKDPSKETLEQIEAITQSTDWHNQEQAEKASAEINRLLYQDYAEAGRPGVKVGYQYGPILGVMITEWVRQNDEQGNPPQSSTMHLVDFVRGLISQFTSTNADLLMGLSVALICEYSMRAGILAREASKQLEGEEKPAL